MTHKELVQVAYKWILKTARMQIAFKELYSAASEIPDVIGFDGWQSILIECKASRSDFLKDKKKPHRAKGMGKWRFYCCPKGMIKREELPPKWGLIYVTDGKARIEYDPRSEKVTDPTHYDGWRWRECTENIFEVDHIEERRLMYSVIRRLFIKGLVKHIYDKQYNRSSTPDELIKLNEQ